MFKMTEFAKRRKSLMQKLGEKSIVIVPSAKELLRNGDAVYPFRQNSDFFYLTGFNEPDAVLVLTPHRTEGEYILFNRLRDREREIWDGPRAGQEGACSDYLADQSFPISKFEELLPELVAGRNAIHYPLGANASFDRKIMEAINHVKTKIRGGINAPAMIMDLEPSLHEMRLFKSKSEIEVMQKAVDITTAGHLRAMAACKPGLYEFELEAELIAAFKRLGGDGHAYNPIVGTGRNSCILHYNANCAQIVDGDMVLIDAGAEYQNYAADVTRTFPANGNFRSEQREIYELVLAAQLTAIKTIKPGASWMAPQNAIVKIITQGLIDLGLLKGNCSTLIEKQAYFPFYMHRSGHWLGMDVHDVGQYTVDKKWRTLEPGMVLTIEPGIYISEDLKGVPKRWHHIGVRIEDDVLVTEKGHHVMSQAIPKKISDIEAVMRQDSASIKR